MLTKRAYSNEQDKLLMAALSRQFFTDNLHVIDLPYRFSSWAFDDPENIRLWFDQDGQCLPFPGIPGIL
jgi:hypothetical protein